MNKNKVFHQSTTQKKIEILERRKLALEQQYTAKLELLENTIKFWKSKL